MTDAEVRAPYSSFAAYKRSLDFLVMIGEPEIARIMAAREAGGNRKSVSDPARVYPPYLYDRLQDAFEAR